MAACLNWKNEHAPTRLVDPDVEAAAANIARAAMVAGFRVTEAHVQRRRDARRVDRLGCHE